MNRRTFLRAIIGSSLAGLGSVAAGQSGALPLRQGERSGSTFTPPKASGKPRVVIARNEKMLDSNGKVNAAAVRETLEAAVARFGNERDAAAVWRRYFSPADVIGLKVNCLGGAQLSTHPQVADAVVESLARSVVSRRQIIIWDRKNEELSQAGFQLNTLPRGVKCFGTDTQRVGYDEELTMFGSAASCVSRIVSNYCTAQINMPLLKDHTITGYTGALKNWFGAIHNPNKYHEDRGDPGVADVNCLEKIRKVQRLIVCDALLIQYEGGPAFSSHWVHPFHALIISADPVALDAVGCNIIEQHRRRARLPSLKAVGRSPTYIATAADPEHRLGVCDLAKIEVIEM